MTEAFSHEQTRAREMLRESISITDQLGFSYKLSDTPPSEASRAPALGENTAELLDKIGISKTERAQLESSGIIVIGDDTNRRRA